MHFWVYISKPQNVVTLKYGEKAPTLGTFKVRHRGVKAVERHFVDTIANDSFHVLTKTNILSDKRCLRK